MTRIPYRDQLLPFASMKNAREMGGFPARDQKTTAFGRFIRADVPLGMGATELDAIIAYPVSEVLDLRSEDEINRVPTPFIDHPELKWTCIPLMKDDPDRPDNTVVDYAADSSLGDLYVYWMTQRAPTIVQIMELLAAPRDGALLLHCRHGKDRSGLIAALLHKLVGVEEELIIQSYQVSYENLRTIMDPVIEQLPLRKQHLWRSEPINMKRVFEYLEQTYGGSIHDYLISIGVGKETIDALEQKLLG